jgi:hypothetical protein
MARTIVYRVKTPAGAWQRAVIDDTALPQSITGLVAGETYQVDTGKGTLVDVTPLNTFTLETFTGTPVVTGPGEYELTVTAPAYLAAYNPGGGAGIYTWDTTELATGPKVLYPGSIDDTGYTVGEAINLVNPAFGVGSGVVDVFYRVYDDGVEVYDGATLAYDTTSIVAGSSVSVRAYMVDQNGESAEATILTFTIGAASVPIARLANSEIITDTNGTSLTSASIAPTAGTNRCAVLIVHFGNSASAAGTVTATWGGNSFVSGAQNVPTGGFQPASAILYMLDANLPGSSQTITVTSTSGNQLQGTSVSLIQYGNVDQATPIGGIGGVTSSGGTGTAANVTVTVGQISSAVITCCTLRAVISSFTSSVGTELYDIAPPVTSERVSRAATEDFPGATGSRTNVFTFSTANRTTSAIELRQA